MGSTTYRGSPAISPPTKLSTASRQPRPAPGVGQGVERSKHVTVRLICYHDGPLAGDLRRAAAPFTTLGVHCEGAEEWGMLALDIAPTDPLPEIVATLGRGVDDGSWAYDEGRITDAWVAATGTDRGRPRRRSREATDHRCGKAVTTTLSR